MIRIPIQVRYNDFDERGHVNNATYLTYFELARAAAWRAVAGDVPPGFILAQAKVDYRSPAVLGDALVVEVSAGEVRSKAWTWQYRVVTDPDGRVVATGETTQVMFDYEAKSTVVIPDEMRGKIGGI